MLSNPATKGGDVQRVVDVRVLLRPRNFLGRPLKLIVMGKIKDLPKIERPREKLERYGAGKMSNSELLAILLGSGRRGTNVVSLSKNILKKFGNNKLVDADVKELKKVFGLGTAKACEIVACFELGRRLLKDKKSKVYLSAKDVWQELKDLRNNKKEHFVAFFLDTQNQEIKRELISIGNLNANIVHPREVFEPAVKNLAAHIIVAHNHPSGNVNPSEADIELTKRLTVAGEILGIKIIDHVIVSKDGFLSFKNKKLIK